nr:MAG TPA: hypothetical protein [Caudoviricetes sp.]
MGYFSFDLYYKRYILRVWSSTPIGIPEISKLFSCPR